ncbi:MAG: TetR family transcriptional regulator [Pseudonocardiaceae bacterium]|nr:TetR family transcriptional regulator [Pseudonocardiaceae bacterium]
MESARKAARRAEVERNDRALLRAARAVVAEDGAHAAVATIAARAGVGVGTLYRRYPTKEQLFQHLCSLALDDYLRAAEEGLAHDDPWRGFEHYLTAAVLSGTGGLGAIAGTITVTEEMSATAARGDAAAEELVRRAHDAAVLRADVGPVDIALLIEQLGRSPLVEQLTQQGRTDLVEAAEHARRRVIAVALDGLRAPAPTPLPDPPPGWELFSERWRLPDGPTAP